MTAATLDRAGDLKMNASPPPADELVAQLARFWKGNPDRLAMESETAATSVTVAQVNVQAASARLELVQTLEEGYRAIAPAFRFCSDRGEEVPESVKLLLDSAQQGFYETAGATPLDGQEFDPQWPSSLLWIALWKVEVLLALSDSAAIPADLRAALHAARPQIETLLEAFDAILLRLEELQVDLDWLEADELLAPFAGG